MSITSRVKERIILGVTHGGQLASPVVDAVIADALEYIYEATELLHLELTPIDEVAGTKEYNLTEIPEATTGRMCRISGLYRVSYNSSDVETGRSLVDPGSYNICLKTDDVASLGSIQEVIALRVASPRTVTSGLIPLAVCAFRVDDYIPTMHTFDVEEAVLFKALSSILSDTGKPWSNKDEALNAYVKQRDAISRIIHKAKRGGTSRNLTINCRQSFI